MKLEELNKMVDHEIQWLSYYSTSESRLKLNVDSEIYSELITMGYCKTPTPLYLRCSICILSNGSNINDDTKLEEMKIVDWIKGDFDYTPLEVYIKLFPSEKISIIERLKPIETNWVAHKSPISNKIRRV